jgi:Glycosyl transferases group 1
MSEAGGARHRRTVGAAVLGVSERQTCGMRDHAVLLSSALADENIACSLHWLYRHESSIKGSRSEFQTWAAAVAAELRRTRPAAVILHYSVFSYSYRGFPLFVRPVFSAVGGVGIPVLTVLHELVYPWKLGGVHGKAWALTQRALLIAVMRQSAAALVTAPARAQWLQTRAWLPRRPIAFAPVFSNLPAPTAHARGDHEGYLLGLFGYAYEGAAASVVLDAIRLLRERGLDLRLRLLGAPGRNSAAADAWLAGARAREIEHTLSFSNVLPAQKLSDALASCDVLLHPEPAGPTSRKGTLAASLASGTAVVAIDGPHGWPELMGSEALLIAQPTGSALADAVAGLLDDERRREELGARGGAFGRHAMGVQRTAKAVVGLLDDVLDRPSR